ncbi:acyl carrier protein [Pseudoalteromonas sp. G4]|uniref:acyl carrier protein n=1 Tax=Pseudoalteromonas sp. G4 TaxID=2992761 RepID=UPI00237D5DA8|nr:acyl carrier protein [Pseudoalteromonas sp. G4]MDE3271244.1 acyl carrier protein [Pseudoalteromonas sp. G4]
MTNNDVLTKIKAVANKLSPSELIENYIESGIFDSMTIMRFVMELEDEFEIDFDEAELGSSDFKTLQGLTNMIEKKLTK